MDAQDQVELAQIKNRAIGGIITFTARTFFIQVFSFFATFLLTIMLSPKAFGIFYIVSAALSLFVYFSDIGLAAALVQKKEKPTKEDLSTAFLIQQGLIIALVVIGITLSRLVGKFYGLDQQGIWLFRILIFSLFLSSLKTIPSIILERGLSFTKLVIPQIVENVTFYLTALVLAYLKFDIASFTWAVLARGIVGLITIYIISPWKPSLSFNKKSAKSLVSFGIPFQLNSILALFKDDLLTVFVGKLLPAAQVGFIGWSQKFAFVPLRFIMDNVIKVTFPAYSRMQHDAKSLKNAVDKSLFFVTFLVYPSLVGIMILMPRLTKLVPNYSKWEPALPLLIFFTINAAFACVNTTLTNVMFAIGKPNIVLKLMIFWTFLTWFLTYPMIKSFGFLGVSIASAFVAASTSVIIYFVKKEINVSVIKNVYAPFVASLIMFFGAKFIGKQLPNNYLGLLEIFVISTFIYLVAVLLMLRKVIIEDIKTVLFSIKVN